MGLARVMESPEVKQEQDKNEPGLCLKKKKCLPFKALFSIPFTSSVRLSADRSTDLAGSSERDSKIMSPAGLSWQQTKVFISSIQADAPPVWT